MSEIQTAKLELGRDGGGARHFIGDLPIHAGDPIAAEIDGVWYDGRYEGSWNGDTVRGWFHFVDKFGNSEARRLYEGAAVRLCDGQRYTP